MAYTPATPNAYDVAQIPDEVRAQFFKEVLLESNLSPFMGADEESVIQVVRKANGTGPTETFNFSREIDYKNPIKGYDQISGKGQQLKFYADTINVEFQALPATLKGTQIVNMNTPLPVFEQLRPKLLTASKRNLTYSVLNSATFENYPDLTAGPVAERVLYGSGDAYNANINTAVAAMTGKLYTQSGVSVAGIKKMRNIAVTGGLTFQAEKRISPYMLKSHHNSPSPFYVYFMDTESFAALEADPLWGAQYARGVIEMANQPSLFNGAYFKGQIGNILIYEMPELGDFRVTSGGKTAAWNLFCGAQALGVVWHKDPWFGEEWSNMKTIVEMAVMEMRGQKAIKFPSFKANNEAVVIENGIIHNLVQIS
jgi:hypothetical protein